MNDCRYWHLGFAPGTAMERRQAQTEAMYEREDMETQSEYELVQSEADKRRQWLQQRQTGIGGSDSPVVLGMSPWGSRYELWGEKSGSLPFDESEASPHLDLGNNLEAVVLRLLALKTGRVVEAAERYKLVRHPEHEWCFCTPDGWELRTIMVPAHEPGCRGECRNCPIGIEEEDRGIVQAKTAFSMNRHDWEPEPPDYYRVQLQHEMLASGCSWGTLAVLFIDQGVLTRLLNAALRPGGDVSSQNMEALQLANAIADTADFRYYDYAADAEFQAELMRAERAFLDLVDAGVAPGTDGSESCRRAIARLHPKDDGTSVDLPDEWLSQSEVLEEFKRLKKDNEKSIAEIENRIKAAIGNATYGVLPDGSRYSLKTQSRKEHLVAASEFRVLRKEKK